MVFFKAPAMKPYSTSSTEFLPSQLIAAAVADVVAAAVKAAAAAAMKAEREEPVLETLAVRT